MSGNRKVGDHMARKKALEELQAEREKAEQDLRMRQENLKKLKQKEAELTRGQRTHPLCTHGASWYSISLRTSSQASRSTGS